MLKKLFYSIVCLILTQQLLAQKTLPIIKATSKSAKIKDGDKMTEGSVMDKKVRFPMSVLGNDLLKRFNVLVDFQNDFIYLKPNKLINMPYRSGV